MENRQLVLRCGQKRYPVTIPEGVRFQYAPLNPVEKVMDPAAAIREARA